MIFLQSWIKSCDYQVKVVRSNMLKRGLVMPPPPQKKRAFCKGYLSRMSQDANFVAIDSAGLPNEIL
jgi:hypothetical protein